MLLVSKEVEFDAGHRVPGHASKCRNPHGHRYRVRASITGELVKTAGASNEGMLADFGDLKAALMELVHDPLDHGFIVAPDDPFGDAIASFDPTFKLVRFPYIPTAENLALWCFEQLKPAVEEIGFALDSVTVWETPTSTATYLPET